jgi:hypothetical protein
MHAFTCIPTITDAKKYGLQNGLGDLVLLFHDCCEFGLPISSCTTLRPGTKRDRCFIIIRLKCSIASPDGSHFARGAVHYPMTGQRETGQSMMGSGHPEEDELN